MPARLSASLVRAVRALAVVVLALMAVVPAVALPAAAAPAADVDQTVYEASAAGPHGQTFVAQTTGGLTAVKVVYSGVSRAGDGWVMTIHDGSPTGPTLGSATVPGTDTTGIATFDTPIGVRAGHTYALEIRSVAGGRPVYMGIALANPYADGVSYYGESLTTISSTYDLAFTTYVDAALAVAPAVSGSAPQGVKGKAYDPFAFTVSGFPAPTVTVSGTLPPGMAVSSSGVLTGTPTASGSFPVTIMASNGVGTAASLPVTLSVREPIKPATPIVEIGVVGVAHDGVTWSGTVPIIKPAADGDFPVTNITIVASTGGSCSIDAPPAYVEAELSCAIAGLPYGVPLSVEVTSTSAAGSTSTGTVRIGTYYSRPSAVLDLAATPGDGSVALTWSAPEVIGDASLRGYQVRYRAVGASAWITTSVTTPHYTAAATNGVPFEFQVRAVGFVGNSGPWTDPSMEATASAVPNAPTAPVLTPGDASAMVQWTAPGWDGGASITGYEVEYRAVGSTTWQAPIEVAAASLEIAPLTNGVAVEVRVRAVNVAGAGPWSEVASVTPRTLPDAPGTPLLVPGDGAIGASWTAPDSDGGAAIQRYEYAIRAHGGASWTVPIAIAAAPYTIAGLANGSAYDVRVRAVNAEGAGPWSPAATSTPFTFAVELTTLTGTALNGATVTPGQAFQVDAGHLPVGSVVVVTFHSDPVELARGTVGEDGTVHFRLSIPAGASGNHRVIATLSGTGAADVSATADVTVRRPQVLAFTGFDAVPTAAAAAALIAVGAVLTVARRRWLVR